MRVITYLGFTLLSILIQFGVMDFIQGKIKIDEKQIDLNGTSHKKKFDEMLSSFKQKPHALYYRTNLNNNMFKDLKIKPSTKAYSNSSLTENEFTTIVTSTILDELYDDSASTTENIFTTETLFTSTDEYDNVTEITFFHKKNNSVSKTSSAKKIVNKDCSCNLLYKVCDINCCCDSDCSEADRKLFTDCKTEIKAEKDSHLCYPYQYSPSSTQETYFFDNLFCIVKTNMPEKRIIIRKKYDIKTIDSSYKWHKNQKAKYTEFQKKFYKYGEPVWVLKEGSIWYIDIPSPTLSGYCNGRKPIHFLEDEKVDCLVNIKDLEMFQIVKTSQEAPCISVTEKSLNSSALNCSSLHCTNWSIIVCDEDGLECAPYNKSLHEPSCTENSCSNIALHLDYIFNIQVSKIINATIKLYVQTISSQLPFMTQEINVKYVLTNDSIDNIVELSGNPGYIYGLPVVSSEAESNYTLNYFNTSIRSRKRLSIPGNKNGICVSSMNSRNDILFGVNQRIKCRYVYDKGMHLQNSTNTCDDIEANIIRVFGISNNKYVSPFGNPTNILDTEWIPVQSNLDDKEVTYGQLILKNSKMRCYNLITRISYIFTFGDVSDVITKREDKIIGVSIVLTTQNVTFTAEDASAVLTVDTNFIDGTKPRAYEYAGAPHLNIHLPKDFFFPFPSNGINIIKISVPFMMICYVIQFVAK